MRARHFLSICFLALAVSAGAAAEDPDKLPLLKDTVLYTETASACWSIDRKTWKSPVTKVFERSKVEPYDIELCNSGKYLILHMMLKYDPEEFDRHGYANFYQDLLSENGYSPLSIVDEKWGKIVGISRGEGNSLHVETERYDAQ